MNAKTPAQRKAAERTRMREAGYTLQQVWVHKTMLERFRKYVARLRRSISKGGGR